MTCLPQPPPGRAFGFALLLVLLVTGAWPAHSAAGQGTNAPTGEVRGLVIAADTRQPVRTAAVILRLQPAGAPPSALQSWRTTTDSTGRFAIGEVPAGRITISVSKAGFVTRTFASFGDGVGATLAPGARLDVGNLILMRGGVVVGRVYDDFGDAASDITVSALRVEYPRPGFRRVVRTRTDTTNDLGEFRIFGLAPGTYYIAASSGELRLATAGDPQSAQTARGMAPAYHPGGTDPAGARTVRVLAGGTATGADVQLASTPWARIRGQVVDSRGRPAPGTVVMLNPTRADDLVPPAIVEADAAGLFTLTNILPGDYRIDAETPALLTAIAETGRASGRPQGADAPEFASSPIRVDGRDIDGLTVAMSAGRIVSGRVVPLGASLSAEALGRITVDVLAVVPGQGISAGLQASRAQAARDGTFEARGVIGRRIIRVTGLPAGWALASVRAFGADVTDEGFDAEHTDVLGVDVMVTPTPTQVVGTVVDDSGAPHHQFAVLVFPEDSRLWTLPMNRFVASAAPDGNGVFRFVALPPGQYRVIALPQLDQLDWADPVELERLRQHATPTTLGAGEAKSITVRLSAVP